MPPKRQRTLTVSAGTLTRELQEKYFSSAKQVAEYGKSFFNREIQKPRLLDVAFFSENKFELMELLQHANLISFLSTTEDIYPELVKAFYCNLRLSNGTLLSEVCHKPIRLDSASFGRIVGLPTGGPLISDDGPAAPLADEYNRLAGLKDFLCNPKDVGVTPLTAGYLTPDSRLLQYVVARLLFPRRSNTSQLLKSDLPVMWVLQMKKQVDWAGLVMQHMYDNRTPGPLPYGHLVTRLLVHAQVPLAGELKYSHDKYYASFNQGSVNKIGLVYHAGQWELKPQRDPPSCRQAAAAVASSSQAVPPPAPALGIPELTTLLQAVLREQQAILGEQQNTTKSVNALHEKVDRLETTLRNKQIIIDSPIRHHPTQSSSATPSASDDDEDALDNNADHDESDED